MSRKENQSHSSWGGKRAGAGRPPGIPNKLGSDIKGMILAALDNVGGVTYLEEQARANPGAFMVLVGRVLPMQVNVDAKVSLELLVTQAIANAAVIESTADDVSNTAILSC
jgi:hypothetical protein